MNQLKATHKKFTQSIYGWDVEVNGSLKPNWFEQNIIDYMDWQINVNGMSASAVLIDARVPICSRPHPEPLQEMC